MVNFLLNMLPYYTIPYCINMVMLPYCNYMVTLPYLYNMVILPNCYHIWCNMVSKKNYHITTYSNFISDYLPYCKKYGNNLIELLYFIFYVILKCYHICNNGYLFGKIKITILLKYGNILKVTITYNYRYLYCYHIDKYCNYSYNFLPYYKNMVNIILYEITIIHTI